MAPARPPLSITLPPSLAPSYNYTHMPRTPEQHDELASAIEPPAPPRAQPFKVRRRRATIAPEEVDVLHEAGIIPTIEMTEVPAQNISPTAPHSPRSAHLLSPMHMHSPFQRAVTPPMTPAPRSTHPIFSQLESPVREWDLINRNTRPFERSGSICSSFSDSSLSSCGSSAFSLPTGACDSPRSEATDPFMDDESSLPHKSHQPKITQEEDLAPQSKRLKTRRATHWSTQMDEHLWMTFMAYLSDPTLTPFKLLPGSSLPMGVCDQVATKAKRTWRPRRHIPLTSTSIDALVESDGTPKREGSPDTIRASKLQPSQAKWPKVAATRKRLRQLCQTRPSISAHYQRMLRTRSPSPFETSSPGRGPSDDKPTTFSSHDMVHSLVTSTAPSMQPNGPLAQLARQSPPRMAPQHDARPNDWYACIGRSQAHKKSLSLQSELNITAEVGSSLRPSTSSAIPSEPLASPFNFDAMPSRSQLLQNMAGTKSLGRTELNGRSLDSPLEFKLGAATERRSRKRRFRSDEEKPRRPALEDVFGPSDLHTPMTRSRGFTVGAARATDNLARLFTPPPPLPVSTTIPQIALPPSSSPATTTSPLFNLSVNVNPSAFVEPTSSDDYEMTDSDRFGDVHAAALCRTPAAHTSDTSASYFGAGTPMAMGSRSAPRRLAEPIPRLGSPFTEMPPFSVERQRNTFPRGGGVAAAAAGVGMGAETSHAPPHVASAFRSFHDRLLDAAAAADAVASAARTPRDLQ